MTIDKIIFFHPSLITGGAEYLFLRCAECLASYYPNYSIYIIEYKDGFARKNVKNKDINFIDYEEGKKIHIPDGAAIITQLDIIGVFQDLFEYNSQKSLFIYWCLHLLNLKNYYYGENFGYYLLKFEREFLGREIDWLAERDIVKFMGYGANIRVMQDLCQKPRQLRWLPNIIPINPSYKPSLERISFDELKFCWLGRLDREKARNVETYMNELESLFPQIRLSLSIIGLGPCEDYLKRIANQYSYPISFVGEKRDEDLTSYITDHCDIGLASGTSALELSMRGKPVILDGLLDRTYMAGERKEYYLTSEKSSYSYDEKYSIIRDCTDYFKNKVDYIIENYESVSRDCFTYVQRYSATNTCGEIVKCVEIISNYNTMDVLSHIKHANKILRCGMRRRNFIRKIRSYSVFPKK